MQNSDNKKALNIPPRSLNGGLFTGEPFAEGAPYANVPVIPDASYVIHYNLRSANAPEDAYYQYPGGGNRPGNNTALMPGVTVGANGIMCNGAPCSSGGFACVCRKCTLSKYAYL